MASYPSSTANIRWIEIKSPIFHIVASDTPTWVHYVKATFVELPAFQRLRDEFLDDDSYKDLQQALMKAPEAGDVIRDTGGLRKVRFADERRGKGKRGGLRVIYYWRATTREFWLFTVYDKNQADDLTSDQRKLLKLRLETEVRARRGKE